MQWFLLQIYGVPQSGKGFVLYRRRRLLTVQSASSPSPPRSRCDEDIRNIGNLAATGAGLAGWYGGVAPRCRCACPPPVTTHSSVESVDTSRTALPNTPILRLVFYFCSSILGAFTGAVEIENDWVNRNLPETVFLFRPKPQNPRFSAPS